MEQYTEYEHLHDDIPLTNATTDAPTAPAPATVSGPTHYPRVGPQQYLSPSQYRQPAHQYPPARGPLPCEQSYGYDQPPAEYSPQPGHATAQYIGAPPSQHQQQQVVTISARQQLPVVIQQVPSYAKHVAFACMVLWCFNPLFGLIAFTLAS